MNEEKFLIAYLAQVLKLQHQTAQLLLNSYESYSQAVEDNLSHFFETNNGLRQIQKLRPRWETGWEAQEYAKFRDSIIESQVSILTFQDDDYPSNLLDLADAPAVLYYQGDFSKWQWQRSCSVVGSRLMASYSKSVMRDVLTQACQWGVQPVSGLALGVDSYAHETALETDTFTLAVIGSGLDRSSFYPRQNWILKEKIATNGVVVSEYPPGTKPTVFNFPRRNRLIATLSPLTWVVQATLKSGSLITSDVARDLGRVVATTPASVLDPNYAGNIKLLKDGCNIITEAEDIYTLLGLSAKTKNMTDRLEIIFENELEKAVYDLIGYEPVLADDIAEKLNVHISQLSSTLIVFEMRGIVESVGDNLWVKLV